VEETKAARLEPKSCQETYVLAASVQDNWYKNILSLQQNVDSFGQNAPFNSVPGSIATDIPMGGEISSAKPNQPT